MKVRLAGGKRKAQTTGNGNQEAVVGPGAILLGVDPSLRGTGYGIIQLATPHPRTLAQGTIACPKDWEHSRCLLRINEELRKVIRRRKPGLCILEGLFYAQNLKTAIVMGEARGAAMVAAAEAGLTIYEIAPRKVKQAIVGYGAAQKTVVARMVQRMLHLAAPPEPDAADALALALAWAFESKGIRLTAPRKV